MGRDMQPTQTDYEQEIKKHQIHYLKSLAEDVALIRKILDQLSTEKIEEVRFIIHRHTGAGGIMGYPNISHIAKGLEYLFDGSLSVDAVIAQRDTILKHLTQLEELTSES